MSIALLSGLFVGWTLSAVPTSSVRSDLDEARAASSDAQTKIEDLQAENDDLEAAADELEAAAEQLRARLKRSQGEITDRIAGTEGLSATVDDVNCTSLLGCTKANVTVTFQNKSDKGGPVSCAFEIELQGGSKTHFWGDSPYVPPDGRDTQVVTWYGSPGLENDKIWVSDSDSCERYGDI